VRGTLKGSKGTRAILSVNALLIFAFLYAPIILLVAFSFSDNRNVGQWGGFTFDWYREFGENDALQDALWVSVKVAVWSTLISVVLGTLSALALERFSFRGKKVFDGLLYLPIIIFRSSSPTSPWP